MSELLSDDEVVQRMRERREPGLRVAAIIREVERKNAKRRKFLAHACPLCDDVHLPPGG